MYIFCLWLLHKPALSYIRTKNERRRNLIEYGKPIYPEELDKETKKHLGVYVRGIIEEMYEENRKKIS